LIGLRWKYFSFLSLFLCLGFVLGCSSSSGVGWHSEPPNLVPVLSGVSPSSAIAGSAALTVTASGSSFVSSSTIVWNGAVLPTTYVSGTSLTAQIPASDLGSAGTATLAVQTPAPGGGTSSALNFAISTPPNPTPNATSLSPSSAIAGGPAFTLTVTGTQFISGSQVFWNGSQVPTTYVSGTSLTAQIPASDLNSVGTAAVAVLNPAPGGGSSDPLSFVISTPPNPAPNAISLSPSGAITGGPAFTLTVAGTQFIPSSQVLWNGSQVPTTYVSGTSLMAQIPASDLSTAGTTTVAVQSPTPGGGTSSVLNFAISTPPNPAPSVISLSPSSTNAGGSAFTLTVTGTQFSSSSQVLWNGSQVPTTYVSGTSLTAQIPASDLSSVGAVNVAVQSPAPGGGTSGVLSFTISQASTNMTVLDLQGSDVAWNPSEQKLYVAVPSVASTNGGTITVVDPIAGSVVSSQQLSSAASGLAISDDSQYLYAVINGAKTIQRLNLPALTPDIQWSLATDPIFGTTNIAGDIKVQPGAPHTLAVSFGTYGSGSVAIFDDAVERPAVGGGIGDTVGNSLQWKASGSELYAAYTEATDNGNWTGVSDNALYKLPVNSNGLGAVTTYDRTFRGEGSRLHYDATTGYVYGDYGEVVNAANGVPVGNFRDSHVGPYLPGPLSVVDSSLKRFYKLVQVNESDRTTAYQIEVFDLTHFQLLSTIVIPNAVGQPTNFIRWGQAGLAFVTSGGSSAAGKLYILDGTLVNPSGVQDTAAGTQLNPVPTLTGISPITVTVGSGGLTATVTGHDFIGQPTVYWNGNALPTTLVNGTELSVQVPASDLTSVSPVAVTASNNGSVITASNSIPFSVNAAPPTGTQISVYSTGGNDLVWDANAAKIYVSMPGIQGDSGDAIGIVDPVAGVVTNSGFLGSDPGKLSLSDNGQYLYMALNGANAIRQLTLPTFQVNSAWNLGGTGGSYGPYYALDLQVAPGAPQTTAVTLAGFDVSPSSLAVAIYDGATQRPNQLQVTAYPYSSLQWAGNDSTLYAVDQGVPQDFLVLGVGSPGAVLNQHYNGILSQYSTSIHYETGTGLVYSDTGQVIQPSNGSIVGSYGASGIAVPDSTLDRVFILGQTSAQVGTSDYTIESFDQTKFTAIASITINNVVGTPTALIRWGSNGLAFTTLGSPADFIGIGPGQLYVINGDFVKSSGTSPLLRTVPMLSVQRTWGTSFAHQSGSAVVPANPLTH
jgi:hypothetical protein